MDTTRRRERAEVQAHVGLRAWLHSALFRSYLFSFVLFWIAGKIANGATAILTGMPPLAFRSGTELVVFAFEIGALLVFIRHANEDILLGNLGLGMRVVIGPLAVVHVVLSALVALVAAVV